MVRSASAPALLIATALVLGACGGGEAAAAGGSNVVAAAAAGDPIDFGPVPDFELTSQLGEAVGADTLRGRPYVMAAVFSTCAGPCPRIGREMAALQEQLDGTDALLVSVTVDPGHDTPEVLAEYAATLGADPERWLFLTGGEDEVYELVREGFKLGVARSDPATAAFGRQVTHGTKLVAVDRRGHIRGWYDSQTPEGVDRLRERMRFLAREDR